ncbi:nitrate ABC transporter ATPase [Leuconostocaceae bacterium ESL0723]|nr:nitrate ABC transporter ATPase [Leuconostocaceae bacterium ESL0723]
MNPKIQTLLDQVNQTYPGTVMVRVGQENSGELHPDHVSQDALADRLLIEVPDQTQADFVLGNELLKMLLALNGIMPQIFFALSFHDQDLDDQLISLATRMHRVVVHAITYQELAQHGLTDEDTVAAYRAGLAAGVSPESDEIDGESLWRLLAVMDALVFANRIEGTDGLLADLDENYPRAYVAAKSLVDPILSADLKQPRQLRRLVVQTFTGVDQTLTDWELPSVNAREYVTLTSVLSKRQLSLPVKQVFDIFHSEMFDIQTQQTAFVGLNKGDQQNSFVIAPPADEADRPAFFRELYDLPVGELFQKLALPYIER